MKTSGLGQLWHGNSWQATVVVVVAVKGGRKGREREMCGLGE